MTTVSYDDFAKLDLRVAKIIATESIEGKSRIIKGRIDLGGDDQIIELVNKKYMELPAALKYEIETSGITKKELQ